MYHVAELREMFLRNLATQNKSPNTLRVYGRAVDKLVKYLEAQHLSTEL